MKLTTKIRDVLRSEYGEFETDLEIEYENKLVERLVNCDVKDRDVWMTYNQVVLEFKKTIKDDTSTKELLYKLTDENALYTEVCIDKIGSVITESDELERLYYKLKNL